MTSKTTNQFPALAPILSVRARDLQHHDARLLHEAQETGSVA